MMLFLMSLIWLSGWSILCFGEVRDDQAQAMKLKMIDSSRQKKPEVSKIDQEFKKKLSMLKQQVQTVINFTPGFKGGLRNFFEYSWDLARKQQDKKEIQNKVIEVTKRLQNDYNQLVIKKVLDALAQLGNYVSIQSISAQNKKELDTIINKIKTAHEDIYQNVISYEDKVKEILSSLLSFADVSPSPYRLWYDIYQTVLENNKIFQTVVEVIQPLLEADNTAQLENHITKAQQNYNFLQKSWKSYEEKATMLLANLRSSIQQEQGIETLRNRIVSAKRSVEKSLLETMNILNAVKVYTLYIPNADLVGQWLKYISSIQKIITQWEKSSKEWQKRFDELVMRHQDVYTYLTERKFLEDFKKSLALDEKDAKKYNALSLQVQKTMNNQKNALASAKQNADQNSK